jgi:hypothetical protein
MRQKIEWLVFAVGGKALSPRNATTSRGDHLIPEIEKDM